MTAAMNLLKRGDRFTLPQHIRKSLVWRLSPSHEIDRTDVYFDPCGGKVQVKEYRTLSDGWEASRWVTIDRSVPVDYFKDKVWEVTHTQLAGGDTGHGQYDVYPDGHQVTAYCSDVLPIVRIIFYQSGCFNGVAEFRELEALR